MDFQTYSASLEVLKKWREKEGKQLHEWPDIRDPNFAKYLEDEIVVGQDIEKAMVSLCAWREMRSAQYQGLSSVVHVIHNRQIAGMFRSHLSEDVTGKNQFSSMTIPGDPNLDKYPSGDNNFLKILENIESILDGKTFDITMGALYYGVIEQVTSNWFMSHIVGSRDFERTVQIERTTFYRPVKK